MHRSSRAGRTQHGNILFLILLAVVLFAALSYAVTQSMRGGGKDGENESASLKAAQIIQYATLIEASWHRLRLRGCGINQISFEHPEAIAAGLNYVNPRAPSNKSCHMFDPNGGGVSYQSFQGDFLVTEQSGNTIDSAIWAQRGHFRFIGSSDSPTLSGVPDDDPRQTGDTVIVFPLIKDSICDAVGLETTTVYAGPFWSLQPLGNHLHRVNQHLDLINNVSVREGCQGISHGATNTGRSRTTYWRIISVN